MHGYLMNTSNASTVAQLNGRLSVLDRAFQEKTRYIRTHGLQENSLYVSQLRDIFQEMFSLIFNFSEEEQLRSLLNIYLEVFPREREHILLFLDRYQFQSEEQKNILIQGDVQSGKTSMMILTAFLYLVYNRDVVFLFRNKTDDKLQFKTRFEQFVKILKERHYENRNFKIADRGESIPEHPCVFMDIYNKKNVQKLTRQIQRRHPTTAVLYIDEADIRDDTKDREFIELVQTIGTKLFVSATIQDILVSDWKIRGGDIVPLFRSAQYRGFEATEFIELEENEEGELNVEVAIRRVLRDEFVHPTHPKIVLLSCERTISAMNEMMLQWMNREMDEQTCILMYTGTGITLYHPLIREDDLKEHFQKVQLKSHGRFRIKTEIKNVLKWMSENGGRTVFPTVMILAGDMASRGINFAYHHPTRSECNWHLTHQIGVKSRHSSCATLNQFMRIFGNHGDDIPLKFYSTRETIERIRQSYTLSKDIMNVLCDVNHLFHREEYQDMDTIEGCKQIPVYTKNVPRKFLAKKKFGTSFQTHSNEHVINPERKPIQSLTEEDIRKIRSNIENHNGHDGTNKRRFFEKVTRLGVNMEFTKADLLKVAEESGYAQPESILPSFYNSTQFNKDSNFLYEVETNVFRIRPEMVDTLLSTFAN